MRAVNLIPSDARHGGAGLGHSGGGAYALLGMLAAGLLLLVLYVVAGNQISDRQVRLQTLSQQTQNAEAVSARLSPYVTFVRLAQSRSQTVRQVAAGRFDWHNSLSQLSQVVPAGTTLQALAASTTPGIGSGGVALRTAIQSPAFELTGCTGSQVDVARLMSRLRLMSGVTRVSLQDTQKASTGATGTAVGQGGAVGVCRPDSPTFHMVVFFAPPPSTGGTLTPGVAR